MSERSKRTAFIAGKIKGLRESIGWSQSELARRSGVTSAAISQIEKGDRLPSLIVIRKLAEALNISEAELTGNSEITSKGIEQEAYTFYRKFGDINNLSDRDQEIIQSLIKRLKKQNTIKC